MENDNDIKKLVQGNLYCLAYHVHVELFDQPGLKQEAFYHGDRVFPSHTLSPTETWDPQTINNCLTGMYLGPRRITTTTGRRRRKNYRKLIHVFLWGNMRVILHPSMVKEVDDEAI